MTTVRQLGSADPTHAFPTLERRSLSVNTANRQLAVGDEAAGTTGAPLALIAVRYFDARAIYAVNDLVVNGGGIFRAIAGNGPGAFNPTQWVGSGGVVVNDTAPAGGQGSLWWESDTGILWIFYNDGSTGQWVQAGGASTTDPSKADKTYVDSQDATLKATLLDALAYNGMQINGSFEVSQESGSTERNTSGYVCDGWQVSIASPGVSVGRGGTGIPGFTNLLYMYVTVAKPSLAATDIFEFTHLIEGFRFSRLAWGTASAQPLTIGFWTAHKRVGTYTVCVRNNNPTTQSYPATYTQNVSGVSEYKTVTIPGCTTGTWSTGNVIAAIIDFNIATGSTYTAPAANVWTAGVFVAAPGQVNGVAATSDVFQITGVVVLPGIEAPSAARSPLIMRPSDQELLTCQRYYEQSSPSQAYLANETSHLISIQEATVAQGQTFFHHMFGVPKRAIPTIKPYPYATPTNTNCMSNNNGVDYPANSAAPQVVNQRGFRLFNNSNTSLTISGMCAYVNWTADARL